MAQFVPGARINSCRPLGQGMIHASYLVHSDSASWVLQRINQQVFRSPEQVMNTISQVQAHLKLSDYPYQVASPLQITEGGSLYRDADGNVWRAFPFLPDTYTPELQPGADEAFEAAKAYGAFLSALRDFPADSLPETIPGFHDTLKRWHYYKEVLSQTPDRLKGKAAPEIAGMEALCPLILLVNDLKISRQLPQRVTHNDTKAGNVLLDVHTHKAVAVIDLDTVMPGVILSDFGDMVRTFVPDRPEDDPEINHLELREDVLSALMEGFLSQTEAWLSPAERMHLMTGACWITAEQALRFLTDYLAGDVYYQVQYPEHNLVRARNQLKIVEKLLNIPPTTIAIKLSAYS